MLLDSHGNQIVNKADDDTFSLVGFSSGNAYYYGQTRYFGRQPALFRGINLLANLGAQLPFQIYKADKLVEDAHFSPTFDLYKPYPNMSFGELLYRGLVHFFYNGEFVIWVNEDIPMRLEVLHPDNLTRLPNHAGWRYITSGRTINIPDENIVFVHQYNPDSADDRGISILDVLKDELANDRAASECNKNAFTNGGKRDGFFINTGVNQSVMERFRQEYQNAYAGAENAYKVLGLPKGIAYQEIGQNMQEMEYIESRRDIRDKIYSTLGIHMALTGLKESVNRAETDAAIRTVWLHTLKPIMTRVQEKFNQILFNNFFPGYSVYFNYADIPELKESNEVLLNQAAQLRALGYTTNEINEQLDLGMDEITDAAGSMRLVPNTLVPVDDYLYEPTPEPAKPEPTKSLDDFFPPAEEIVDKAARASRAYRRNYDKVVRKHERVFARRMSGYFSKQLGKIIGLILSQKEVKTTIEVNTLLSLIQNELNAEKDKLVSVTTPLYQTASADADALAITTIGKTAEAAANEVIVANMANKITGISNHTYRMLRTQIKDGVNAGETIDQIADRVRGVYKMHASRSRIIAQTEVQGIVNRTADDRYRKENVQKKQWIATMDSNTRETHADNASQGAVPYDHVYSNGQSFPCDGNGGASSNINCRCCLAPVIE